MVDDDEQIIYQDDRDSVRLGQYLIGEKIQYLNDEMEAEQGKNYDLKKKTRMKMVESHGHKHESHTKRKDPNAKAIAN